MPFENKNEKKKCVGHQLEPCSCSYTSIGAHKHIECIHTDTHGYMRIACVNMPWSQHLHTQVSLLIRAMMMMMLPAKTPTHQLISCCSKLSCLITAIKLCVPFVHKFWCVKAGMRVRVACNNMLLCNCLTMFISCAPVNQRLAEITALIRTFGYLHTSPHSDCQILVLSCCSWGYWSYRPSLDAIASEGCRVKRGDK